MIDSLRAVHPDLIVIDGGNFGQSVAERVAWKSAELFKTMCGIGYDAISLGDNDLFDGLADSVAAVGGERFLFSSLHTGMNLAPTKVVSKSGVRVGFINAVSASVLARLQSSNGGQSEVAGFVREQLGKLQTQNLDFYAVVFLGPQQELLELSRKFPEVDLWLQTNGDHHPIRQLDSAPSTLVVSGGDRGREVAFITVEKAKGEGLVSASFRQIILDATIKDSPKATKYLDSFRQASQAIKSPRQSGQHSSNSDKVDQ